MKIIHQTNEIIILEDGTEIEKENLVDGEVIAFDNDDNIIQWDAERQSIYNSGENIETFGRLNLRTHEINRLDNY